MSVDRQHPAEPMPSSTAPDDFLRGVEHGQRRAAEREVALRLNLEENVRERVDHAVRAVIRIERRRARIERRRRSVVVAVLVAVATYNLTLRGITAPW